MHAGLLSRPGTLQASFETSCIFIPSPLQNLLWASATKHRFSGAQTILRSMGFVEGWALNPKEPAFLDLEDSWGARSLSSFPISATIS